MKYPWDRVIQELAAPVVLWRECVVGDRQLELACANPAAVAAFRFGPNAAAGAPFKQIMPDHHVMPKIDCVYEFARTSLRSHQAKKLPGVSVSFPQCSPLCFHLTFVRLSDAEVAMIGESPYKGFIDKSSDVFGVLAPDSSMLYRSPSGDTIFGYSPGESSVELNGGAVDAPGLEALMEARDFLLTAPQSVRTIEFRRLDKQGTFHDMEIIARDFIGDPDVGGILFNTRDISRRKADERRILALNEDLDAFTYTVSHDLKLPLRLVTELLSRAIVDSDSTLSDKAKADLAKADALVQDMTVLIRDLLAFSRTGTRLMQRTTVNLSSLAGAIRDELEASTDLPQGTICIEDGLTCFGDPALLRQVVVNLLSNAVKFSQNQVCPRIHVGGSSNAAGSRIFVRDNGIGFDAEHASHIFTVFRRLHQDVSISGTGVGLAIVKRIVERHGGRVWAEGLPGVGATIYFELPHETENACDNVE